MAKFTRGKGKDKQTYETTSAVERTRLLTSGWTEEKQSKSSGGSAAGEQKKTSS